MVLSKAEKPRVSEAFTFLLPILRIPSLDIKPAKYLWAIWLISACKSGDITLDFGVGA
jgi:hypothetical protein